MAEHRKKRKGRKRSGGESTRTPWRLRMPRRRVVVLLAGVGALGLLVVGNVWVFRRQFPQGRAYSNRFVDAARASFRTGDDAAALEAARKAYDESPDDRRSGYVLALALERNGLTDDARALLDERVGRDLEDDEGRVLLAAIARREEDYARALELLSEAVAREPTPGAAWRLIGEIRALTGDRDGAAEAFRQSTTRDADDLRGWLAFGDLQLAVFMDTGGRVAQDDAVRAYTAAERICRRRLEAAGQPATGASSASVRLARLGLAKALAGLTRAARDRTVAQATEALETIIAEAGDVPEPTLVLAEFFRRFGDLVSARETLDGALRRWDTAAVRLSLHGLLVELGEDSDARAVLERGMEKDPGEVALPLALAAFHAGRANFDAAEALLDAAAQTFAHDARVHEARGDVARARARVAEDAGDLDGAHARRTAALAAYDRALEVRPRSMPLRKKRMGELLEGGLSAGARLTPRDLAAAREYVSDVLDVNPGDADALAWRARLLLLDDRAGQAFSLLEDAADGAAPTVDVLRLFGAACERTGRDDRAADAYERVVASLTRRNEGDARDDRGASAADWANVVRGTLRTERPELGARLAADAVAAWPRALRLHMLLAQAHLLQRDTARALVALARAGAEFPDAAEPRVLAAAILERAGRADEAESSLRAAVLEMDDETAHMALAAFLARAGRADEAEAEVATVLERTSDRGRVLLRLGGLRLAADPPRIDAAREAYDEAARLMSDPSPALARLADLALLAAGRDPLLAAGRDPEALDGAAIDVAADAVAAFRAHAGEGRILDYLEGKLALLQGRADEAVERLQAHVSEGLPSASGLYYLAKALRRAGRPREAEAPLARAQATAPGEPALEAELEALRVDLGVAALSRGDFAAAVLALSAANRGAAGPPSLLLAGARAGLFELDAAERHAREQVERVPGDRAGRHVLAAVLTSRGGPQRLAEARDIYAALIDDERPDEERSDAAGAGQSAPDVHARTGLASVLDALGDAEGCLAASQAAWEVSGGAPGPARGVATSLDRLGRLDEAVAFLARAGERAPEAVELGLLQGDLVLRSGDAAAAAAVYLRVADSDPTDERAVLGRAASLAEAGRGAEARVFLTARIPALATPQRAWLALADLAAREGLLEEADAALVNARSGAVETPHGVLLRGQLAEAAGDAGLARRLYTSGVERGARSVGTLRRLGHLLAQAGEVRLAQDAYEKLLRLVPDDVVALNNLALLLVEDPRLRKRAVQLAEEARDLAPDDAAVADTLGWVLLESSRPVEAWPELQRAAAGAPQDALIRFHAGLAAARLSLIAEARVHLEAALAIDPAFPGADAARSQLERLR